jgi:hypothetical protein
VIKGIDTKLRSNHYDSLRRDNIKVVNKDPRFLQKYHRKSRKRKTQEIKGFGTRLRRSNHYDSLSHIQFQATHKDHKSWMAKSSKQRATVLSTSHQKHSKMKEHSHQLSQRDG